MKASEISFQAGVIAHDKDAARWLEAERVAFMNDAQRQIVLLLPNANSVTTDVMLAKGTQQQIPAGGIRLMRLVRNIRQDGRPGKAIVPTTRAALDNSLVDWHGEGANEVELYWYDPETSRKEFWVYPSPRRQIKVQMIYSKLPTEIGVPDDDIGLDDHYAPAILDWLLYRMFSVDADYGGNGQRAQDHLKSFYQQIGLPEQAAMVVDPRRRVRGSQ